MRSHEFIVERAERARDAIENIVSMGNADDYFVRFTGVDKLGYSAKQDFGRTPDIGSAGYDPDALPRKTGRPALWFYPAKYYLQNQDLFASDKPYIWLVKKRPNAYLQPTARATKPEAPAGMTRAGLMHKESGVPVAIFFRPEFDVIDRWHEPQRVRENFADGKKPGRKGLAKRVGVNCKQSVSKLRKIAANSSGERQRMAHWCANMKSGKQKANETLDEVEELDYVSKSKAKGFRGPRSVEALQKKLGLKKVLDQGNFSIWQGSRGTFGGKIAMYYVVDNRTGEAQIQLLCNERNNVLSDLNLFAAPGNTIKAVDFYRILITKLNKVLVGDRQSPGSQAVWAKLNKFPDVNIHGWLDGKPVNIDTRDREYAYGSAASKTLRMNPTTGYLRQVSNDSPENRDARNMKLVAHKK